MPETHLEFEKPIVELRKKLQELQELSENNQLDLSNEINSLTERMNQTMKEIYSKLTPWQRVQLARHPERPYTLDYIDHLFTNFIELSGDRRFRDDKAIVGGFAKFQGKPVMVIGTQKGRDMKSNVYRNFGWPSPEGYRKAMRLMQLADKADVPIITLIDTPGSLPGHLQRGAAHRRSDRGQSARHVRAAGAGHFGHHRRGRFRRRNRHRASAIGSSSWRTPIIRSSRRKDARRFSGRTANLRPQAADALQLTAEKLLELGIADAIIPEPFGGAQRDHEQAAKLLGEVLAKQLSELRKLSGSKLREQRYEKFRFMGRFIEGALPAPGEQESPEAAAPEGDAAKEAVE